MKKRRLNIFLTFLFLAGCATAPVQKVYIPEKKPECTITTDTDSGIRNDKVHVVAPGETLWRIGKMYNVPISAITRKNCIRNAQKIKMGQRLVIPNAASLKPVVSLYPSKKWKYIIIHHSATDQGNSLEFNTTHNRRGFKGIGYHFVIDNGTKEKSDGQIEATPRWTKQLNGAHCKANHMNSRGIGICLVGNFSKEKVSKKQMDSLVYLVNRLRKYYKIPKSKILGHGQVKGAKTECPGKKFPWKTFRRRILY